LHVQYIKLKNFRNYEDLYMQPHRYLNIITGRNAQGKTNLLEGIYFAHFGRSYRTPREKEVINWFENFVLIEMLVKTTGGDKLISIGINKNGEKKVKINGKINVKGKLYEVPGTVLFTPDDLTLVSGSPQQRRNFLDMDIGTIIPRYNFNRQQYKKVLFQRNNLLKRMATGRSYKNESLAVWDSQLVAYGSKIILERIYILRKLAFYAEKMYAKLSKEKEKFSIHYLSSLKLADNLTEESISTVFFQALKKKREEEINKKQTLTGPHRDDLKFTLNGYDARSFASRGQQRTIALALKLAQMRLLKEESGEYPILLLDDVLFELDKSRKKSLFDEIYYGYQVFLTTDNFFSGVDYFTNKGQTIGKIFFVQNGKITGKNFP